MAVGLEFDRRFHPETSEKDKNHRDSHRIPRKIVSPKLSILYQNLRQPTDFVHKFEKLKKMTRAATFALAAPGPSP